MKIITVVLIVMLAMLGCTSGEPSPASSPTAPPAPTPTPTFNYSIITPNSYMEVYSNGLPDYSYYPLELAGGLSSNFTEWIRPVIPAALDMNNNFISHAPIRGIGILCESDGRQFVISSSGPFIAAPISDVDKAAGLKQGALLVWDIKPGVSEGGIIDPHEVLEVVKTKTGELFINESSGLILLERINPGNLPLAAGCPFDFGTTQDVLGDPDSSRDDVGQALIIVGHRKDLPELIMPHPKASIVMIQQDKGLIHFSGSVWPHDWGGPIFYILDGKPKLIGILTGAFSSLAYETRGLGITIEKAFETIYEQTGIDFRGG